MLTQREILFAVRNILKEIRNVPVYLHEVRERYRTPCFALTMVKNTKPLNENAGTFFNDCILGISYLTVKGTETALEIFAVQDEITEKLLRGLIVGDRFLHFEEFDGEVAGAEKDILYIEISFNYTDQIVTDGDETLIGNIGAKINLTEWESENGGKKIWQS